jgi:DNA mismatch repair protein MutL
MGQIKILGQNMVNMIAAGEVIERPASIVKELMENSIDAGATKIAVSIEQGGMKLISVSDNGSGMDAEDIGNAFEPHATSKIKNEKDLQTISTFGFRGEALASIAAVAQVKAATRTKNSESGFCINIDCGEKGDAAECGTDYGTTIQVRDLFYKLPARRKFLKTDNTELSHIVESFTRIALPNSRIEMVLVSNNREVFHLGGDAGLRQRIAELLSTEIADNLIEVNSEDKKTGLGIRALIGRPEISKTSNKFQYIFINGRFIRDKFISHAIKEAYRGTIDEGRFPVVFLFIRMPFEDYDVNVHPSKIEVRFYNANLVHSQILAALREKILSTDLGIEAKLPEQKAGNQQINDAISDFFRKYRPGFSQQHLGFEPAAPAAVLRQQNAGADAGYRQKKLYTEQAGYEQFLKSRNYIQIHDCFIVTETDDGFCIIDQHALHERIMYENLRNRIEAGKLESQKLLMPESFEVTAVQAGVIENNAEIFEKLGIELTAFGPKTFAIQSFPALLSKAQPVDLVKDLIDLLADKENQSDERRVMDKVLHKAACSAAVKAGEKLCDNEIEELLAEGDKVEQAGRCPHGRPTMIKFSKAELEKQFKRT